MQIANQTFYITIFVILIGLMAVFLARFDEYKSKKSNKFWPISLGLFATSALAFFLVPWTSHYLLILANISLIWGGLSLCLLFRSWRSRISPRSYAAYFILAITLAVIYIILLFTSTTVVRIYYVNSALTVLAVWQIYELLKSHKVDHIYQIKHLVIANCLQIAIRSGRSFDIYVNVNTDLSSIYQEGLLGFSLRVASIVLIVLTCVFVTNYYLEKLWRGYKSVSDALEEGFLLSLNALASARDNETGNHIIRTREYVRVLGQTLHKSSPYKEQISQKDVDLYTRAAPLHDIGKVGIPDHILKKNDKLSDSEWEIMKTHAALGESVLREACPKDLKVKTSKLIDAAIQIAGGHHEKWDGSGYPRGLKGVQIPLAARLMAVADSFDALVSERVYKKSWSSAEAYEEIVGASGTRFDPIVIEAFISSFHEFEKISKKYKD